MWSRQVQGKSRPLLCLHGWGQSHRNLEQLATLLTCESDPILFDLPGFGKSQAPASAWSAADYAKRLIQYMDEQEIRQTSILGHSFGGKIAMCAAINYPQRIHKLILLAPSGLLPKLSWKKKIRQMGIRLTAKAVKKIDQICQTTFFEDTFIPRFGSADYQSAKEMRAILVKSVNEDLFPLLHQIQCPTLLLWGEKDIDTPLEMGYRLHAAIPNAQIYTFPHHNHYLQKDVGAHLMASYIIAFLKGQK